MRNTTASDQVRHSGASGNPFSRHVCVAALVCALATSLAFAQGQQAPPASAGVRINPNNPRLRGGFTFARGAGGVPLLNFTTVLRDPAGKPMTGNADLTFFLCASKEGGNAAWTETQRLRADENGVISASIGGTQPGGFPIGLVNSGEVSWFGYRIGEGQESQNRFDLSLLVINMYGNFLQYQAELDREAAELDAKGQDGAAVGNEYQRALGLGDAGFAVIRSEADSLGSQLSDISAQARGAAHGGLEGPSLPSGQEQGAESAAEPSGRRGKRQEISPEERYRLRALSDQREDAIQQAVADVRARLSADVLAKVDDFVEFEGGGVLPSPIPPPSGSSHREHEGKQ